MIAQHRQMALLAGLLTAALSLPARAADVDALKTKAPAADESMVALASPQVNPGQTVAFELT